MKSGSEGPVQATLARSYKALNGPRSSAVIEPMGQKRVGLPLNSNKSDTESGPYVARCEDEPSRLTCDIGHEYAS